jgi:hypothetical protein
MLLFLFFLVFLLHDVQLVIPSYGIVLYRFRNCGYLLQVLFYDSRAGRSLRNGRATYSLRCFQNLQSDFKN